MDNQNNNHGNFSQSGNSPQQADTQTAEQTNAQAWQQYYQHYHGAQQQSAYHQQQQYGGYAATQSHYPKPRRRFYNAVKTILTTVTLARSIVVLILLFMLVSLLGLMFVDTDFEISPMVPHFSVINIDGTITGSRGFGESGYDHNLTVNYIRSLIDNPLDRGILLYLDTPGGTVFHSDELYLLLLEYKERTGRPVYAYMASMCASGGVYIAMAADYIIANRITLTGSIGVITTLLDTSQLFYDFGLRTVIVDTGEHKSAGAMGTEITPQQAAVFQSIVDESFDLFVSIVAAGRNMDEQTVRQFADGRLLTAEQALDVGLIDEISTWQDALDRFSERTGAMAFHPVLRAPLTFWESMLVRVPFLNHTDPIDMMLPRFADLPPGVPLAVAPELIS